MKDIIIIILLVVIGALIYRQNTVGIHAFALEEDGKIWLEQVDGMPEGVGRYAIFPKNYSPYLVASVSNNKGKKFFEVQIITH